MKKFKHFVRSAILRISWFIGILYMIPLLPLIGIAMVILTVPVLAATPF